MNIFDVRIRCVYDCPPGEQNWRDATVMVEAADARQAIGIAAKLAGPKCADGHPLISVSTHGLDMRPLTDEDPRSQPPKVEPDAE